MFETPPPPVVVPTPTPISEPQPPASIQQPVLFEELKGQEEDLNTAFFLPEYDDPPTEVTATSFADVHTMPMFNEAGAVNDAAIPRNTPSHAPLRKAPIRPVSPAQTPADLPAVLAEEVDAVDFFASPSSDQTTLVRSLRRWGPWFVAVLVLALGLQTALATRHWIVGFLPAARPHLEPLVSKIGYDLHAPRHLQALSLSSAEVRALEQVDRFVLSAVLVNRTKHNVRWPAFMLILNNPQGEPVARRVIYPNEFLDAAQIATGISGGAEHDLRVAFSIPGIKLGDYTLSLLYP